VDVERLLLRLSRATARRSTGWRKPSQKVPASLAWGCAGEKASGGGAAPPCSYPCRRRQARPANPDTPDHEKEQCARLWDGVTDPASSFLALSREVPVRASPQGDPAVETRLKRPPNPRPLRYGLARSVPCLLLRKPVFAAVEAHPVPGGLELARWCDRRVAAIDAVFGAPPSADPHALTRQGTLWDGEP